LKAVDLRGSEKIRRAEAARRTFLKESAISGGDDARCVRLKGRKARMIKARN
jgi:hypothetical protein